MKIAVSYENGEVFQHFGRTPEFKIYDVVENSVVSTEVIGTDGVGHEALAEVLAGLGVDTLICGGCGQGAQDALFDAGIEVISGAVGTADRAVEEYLAGEIETAGVNCDHHNDTEEEEGCGGCSGGCGSGCGGCGGGCGGSRKPDFDGQNVGKTLKVHYRGTFNDGTQFDASYDRNEPLEFTCGAGMMIHGFDKACADLNVGEKINIHLMPEEAYGPYDPDSVITAVISELPGSETLNVGDQAYLQNIYGHPFRVTVKEKTETEITFDANHEMAGKELNFEIELVEVK